MNGSNPLIAQGDEATESSARMVLHMFQHELMSDAIYLLSPGTIDAAIAAGNEPDLPETFGELRRSGDLDELEERLDLFYSVTLEVYVSGVERAANRKPSGDNLGQRLQALNDFDFDGVDSESDDFDLLPSDREGTLELDLEVHINHPMGRFLQTIAFATQTDVPDDLFRRHCERADRGRPGGDMIDAQVKPDHLDALISELEQRGYMVIRDSEYVRNVFDALPMA